MLEKYASYICGNNETRLKMRKVFTLLLALAAVSTSFAQTVFYTQSFEKPWGGKLSHTFDDGFEDYAKRDTTMSGMDFTAFGKDGNYYIGLEDLDAESTSPMDGVVSISIDSIDITSKKDLEVLMALAGNPTANKYDEAALGNGDSILIEAKIDNGVWQRLGFFCAPSGSNSGPMYLDLNNNKLGGDLGEPSLGAKLKDFTFGVTGTGTMMYIRISVRLDSGDEEIALDNVRVQEKAVVVSDSTTVSFGAASYNYDETAGTVTLDITADKVVGTGTVTATVNAVDGTATNGTNYSFTSSTVSFTSTDLTESITFSITDDMVYNGDLKFDLELVAGTGMVKVGVATTAITIKDDEYATVSLKDLRTNDANGVSIYDGQNVWSGGIVNTATSFNSGAVNIYFQSGGYGIGTFLSGLTYMPQVGDSIIIRGNISQFAGLTQFNSADSFRVVSSGNAVVPEVITSLTEAKEGVLVRLEGLTVVDNKEFPADGSDGDVAVTDGINTFNMRVDRDTDIDGRDTFNVGFDLVGIISQFDRDDNIYDVGYQILPRNWWDLELSEYDRTIAQLRMNDTIEDKPLLNGKIIRTRGIVNNGVNFREGGLTLSIESAGWGVSMFGFDVLPEATGLNVGDSVEVLGTMGEFNGLAQIVDVDTIIVRSTGNMMVPEIVTELNEQTESRLVTFQDLTMVDTNDFQTYPTRDYSADVTNGTVTFTMRINVETDIRNMAAPGNTFHLTGIGGQFDNSGAPYDAGYQLMPRSKTDIDVLVSFEGINEVSGTVYPNPTSGMVTIQANDEIAQVTVFNLVGTEVLSNTTVGNTLDISSLDNGVYILKGMTANGASFTTRVVKR